MDDETFSTDLTHLYHLLSASRRCQVIQLVANNRGNPISIRELARRIAGAEENISPESATGEPYRNVYNSLSQTHLPALSDAKIIIYDSQRQVVSGGPQLDIAALLLSLNQTAYQTLEQEGISDLGM